MASTSRPSQGRPTHQMTSTTGTSTAALATRVRSTAAAGLAAEPARARREIGQGGIEGRRVKVGPVRFAEVELRVRRLPDQEVAEALVPAGPDDQVRLRQIRR